MEEPRPSPAGCQPQSSPIKDHEAAGGDRQHATLPRKTKACLPCHERKVRCDASENGVPCRRCIVAARSEQCSLRPTQPRILKRKHQTIGAELGNGPTRLRLNRIINDPIVPVTLPISGTQDLDNETRISNCGDNRTWWLTQENPSAEHACAPSGQPDHDDGHQAVLQSPVSTEAQVLSQCSASVQEEDFQTHICQEMASGQRTSLPASTSRNHSVEIIEYQNGMNATSILGEVLGQKESKRLTRATLLPSSPTASLSSCERSSWIHLELSGLEEEDRNFLELKGAFNLPPRPVCEEFLQLYFAYAYPYAPILDRREFLDSFENDRYSTFLMQSLLANVVPYASPELIRKAGFGDHATTHRLFFKKAVLLYDFNCEKNQLHLLQGSLLLGTQWISYFDDKDYRYWLANAVRIATRMGIHKQHIENELDTRFHKLLRRIWWVIYIRDVLCTISGLENVRRIASDDCDTKLLNQDDWPEEKAPIPDRHARFLPAVTRMQKLCLIEICRLALIGTRFHAILRKAPLSNDFQMSLAKLLESTAQWPASLPNELRMDSISRWDGDSMWVIVMMVWYHRMECLIFRFLVKTYRTANDERENWATEQLQNALFQLDTSIKRAVMYNMERHLPMSISTSAATAIALHVEILLNPTTPKHHCVISKESIRINLTYLKEAARTWTIVRSTLRLFDWVFMKKGLPFNAGTNRDSLAPGANVARTMSQQGLLDAALDYTSTNNAPPMGRAEFDFEEGLLMGDIAVDLDSWIEWEYSWAG